MYIYISLVMRAACVINSSHSYTKRERRLIWEGRVSHRKLTPTFDRLYGRISGCKESPRVGDNTP